jgi:ketosteroid isomerase-like protein
MKTGMILGAGLCGALCACSNVEPVQNSQARFPGKAGGDTRASHASSQKSTNAEPPAAVTVTSLPGQDEKPVVETNLGPAVVTQPAPEGPAPSHPATAPDLSAETRVLLDTDRRFAQMCREKGTAEAFYTFLAPEGLSLQPGEMPIRGSEAIRVKLSAAPPGVLTWTVNEAEVSAGGDMGYTWGTYEFRGENEQGKRITTYGKYVTIWKKQPDGSWKVVLDAGSPSPAPVARQ